MSPRTCIVTGQFPPQIGGMGQSAHRVATLLAEGGWEVDVAVFEKVSEAMPLDDAIETRREGLLLVHRIKVPHPTRQAGASEDEILTRYHREMFQALDHLQEKRRYHLLHGFFLYPAGFVAVMVGRLHRVPTLVSIRGNDVGKFAFDPHRMPFVRLTLEHADAVTSVATRLTELADRTLAPIAHKSRTILNSVGPDAFRPRSRPDLPIQGPVVGSAGLFRYKKGLVYLFRALQRVHQTHPGTLLLAGDWFKPEEREPHERDLRALGLMERTVFTGRIPADGFAGYLQLFDVLVMPSLFSEGCPRVMIEAMAQGRAVIGARSGAIPEVIRDGENGRLVTPGSTDELAAAILELLEDRALRERLGARAIETARQLTPERERRAWLEVHAALHEGAPVGARA